MTSSNGSIFRVAGPLCGEFTGELWCFLWASGWVNNREAGDLRGHGAHYDVTVFSAQRASIAGCVSMSWRYSICYSIGFCPEIPCLITALSLQTACLHSSKETPDTKLPEAKEHQRVSWNENLLDKSFPINSGRLYKRLSFACLGHTPSCSLM